MYSDIFSKIYDAFGWNYYPESFAQLLLRWIDEQGLNINNMLDLGCGTGILCNMIAEHGIETMGMDLSHGMIAMAKQNYPHIVFQQGNMIDWKPEINFDLVTSTCDAINHILEPEDVKKVMNIKKYRMFIIRILIMKHIWLKNTEQLKKLNSAMNVLW